MVMFLKVKGNKFMNFKIVTWNINSIRLREALICSYLKEEKPDIICLQECKCEDDLMPKKNFFDLGYHHFASSGQKSYNGVAIISKHPLEEIKSVDFCNKGDARHISAKILKKITLHNFYIPAGGDIPDRKINKKFDHKLKFLSEMSSFFKNFGLKKTIILGDFNIAPLNDDVWSHKSLVDVVSHTSIEIKSLDKLKASGNFQDIVRFHLPEGKLYSWWSYRAKDWKKSNRGRRLDHIWVSKDLVEKAISSSISTYVRDWKRTSDHVPVLTKFKI